MSLVEAYQQDCDTGLMRPDQGQLTLFKALEVFRQTLEKSRPRWFKGSTKLPFGFYIWGSVGAGKTYIMDSFYAQLSLLAKRRVHYHTFMQEIHEGLKQYEGKTDPLKRIVKGWKKSIQLLCLDEFFVKDIGDAMVLATVLTACEQEGIHLVMTSNTPPHRLYENGLQRSRFLPAIELIQSKMVVHHLTAAMDYRQRHVSQHPVYFQGTPLETEPYLIDWFHRLAPHQARSPGAITVLGRQIPYVARAGDLIWFNFEDLCHVPRSQLDYVEIAQTYTTLILANIPVISEKERNRLLYLTHLVDVLYDRKVRLIVSAAAFPEGLYPQNGPMAPVFERTQSRLIEMQSPYYWHQERECL